VKQAFKPNWDFTNRFTFAEDSLVPWPALQEWIPRRVTAWVDRLEASTRPEDYRALRLASLEASPAGLQRAARSGVDMVALSISIENNRLVHSSTLALEEAFQFCQEEPMGALLEPADVDTVDRLAWMVRTNELQDYVILSSADAGLVSRYKSFVPNGKAVIQLLAPDQDPLEAAQACGALFINPRWERLPDRLERLKPGWIQRVHDSGLGILSWPVSQMPEAEHLQRSSVDAIWFESPEILANPKPA
jgi:hypothetical protein